MLTLPGLIEYSINYQVSAQGDEEEQSRDPDRVSNVSLSVSSRDPG